MKIIAGLDIQNRKCVQLTQGDVSRSKVFCEQPLKLIKKLETKGVDQFHIVDIDGVFSGETMILDLLTDIRKATTLPIQFGGGIGSFEIAEKILSIGIEQIVIGTSAIHNEELLIQLVQTYGDRIIVAADIYKNEVSIDGWEENSAISIQDFLHTLSLLNVKTVMITDISKDETLSGIDETFVDNLIKSTDLRIILSGGVRSDADIELLRNEHIHGTVVSTALYENLITV